MQPLKIIFFLTIFDFDFFLLLMEEEIHIDAKRVLIHPFVYGVMFHTFCVVKEHKKILKIRRKTALSILPLQVDFRH